MTVAAMRMFRRACALSSVAWVVALPLATWFASRPDGREGTGYAFAFGTYAIGSLVCHQRPERSFFLFGIQMPVCARCLGLYVSAAAAALCATAVPATTTPASRIPVHVRAAWWRIDAARLVLAMSSLPTVASLAYEWATGTMPANVIRAASAAPLGAVVGWLLTRPDRGRGEIN